ncbi:hypothetical protein CBR_g12215 [Chara braunii]|uniref:rRNA biogenesis protein RRP36 n=1 Tax=Chara braunii TaxID=69332 RepID=A0A388KRE5_CHABU|nr:hypothetical protein CBR_g12215 [Chara braunii]|eukprot:GBG72641.1 hypothetical protein CBR_g12215 [Chara braunii]
MWPVEISSKRPVPRFREVVQPTKKEIRDPRFESLSGKFSETGFRKAYGFLFDEVLPAEKESLKQELTKAKREGGDAKELEDNFSRVERLLKEDQKNQAKKDREREIRKKQLDQIKQGKKPFFLKKSEEKKIELMGKFEELKEKGNLDAYITKKRKKNAAKDRRFMPYRRPVQNERKR